MLILEIESVKVLKKQLIVNLSAIKSFGKARLDLTAMRLKIFRLGKYLKPTLIILPLIVWLVTLIESAFKKDENIHGQVFF